MDPERLQLRLADLPEAEVALFEIVDFLEASERLVLALIAHVDDPNSRPTVPAGGAIEAGLIPYWIHHPPPDVQSFIDSHRLLRDIWDVVELAIPTHISKNQYDHLWNKVDTTGVSWTDGTLFGTAQYEQLDPGWIWSFVNYVYNVAIGPAAIHEFVCPPPVAMPLDSTDPKGLILGIVGDWGTGFYHDEHGVECPAERVADELGRLRSTERCDYVVHLGDVYYAGTGGVRPPTNEEQTNFVEPWEAKKLGAGLTLNSNHEMYSGAFGLFDIALTAEPFKSQANSTIWARSYGTEPGKEWLVLGLDSAIYSDAEHGHTMYMDGAIGSSTQREQIEWLESFRDHPGPVMVVTHHNPCDTLDGTTNVLYAQVNEALGREPDLWYWGHVHNGIVYDRLYKPSPDPDTPRTAVATKGRCCGHGSIPFGEAWGLDLDNVSYYAHTRDPKYPAGNPRALNGYATVQLHPDGTFSETFFEVGRGVAWQHPDDAIPGRRARPMNVTIVSRPSDDQFARVDLVKKAVGQPVLPGDDRSWILGEELVVDVGDGEIITIPVGFTTDGASIPAAVQRLTRWRPFEGPQRWAGIVHDWLYYQDGYERERADQIFRDVLRAEGAGSFRTAAMYWAVRLFGKAAYDSNQGRDVNDRIWGNPAYPRHA